MADEQQRLAMRTAAPSSGSRTVTINETQASISAQELQQTPSSSTTAGVLHLHGAAGNDARRVAWSEGTVDNEGMGRKKSKICCIYHKPKAFDESSDEASSSADSDDGSDSSASSRSSQSSAASGVNASKALRAKKATAADKAKQAATADSGEPDACSHHHSHGARKARKASSHRSSTRSGGSRTVTVLAPPADSSHKEDGADDEAKPSKPKPNAYERAPV